MGEQTGPGHDGQAGIGEPRGHLAGPLDGEERVPFAPHQLHRHVDATVDGLELAQVAVVEAPQEVGGRLTPGRDLVERGEEELVVALLDGLLLLRQLAGPTAAQRAARDSGSDPCALDAP